MQHLIHILNPLRCTNILFLCTLWLSNPKSVQNSIGANKFEILFLLGDILSFKESYLLYYWHNLFKLCIYNVTLIKGSFLWGFEMSILISGMYICWYYFVACFLVVFIKFRGWVKLLYCKLMFIYYATSSTWFHEFL